MDDSCVRARWKRRGEIAADLFAGLAKDLFADTAGQDMIEYALVAALVGLGAVTAMKGLSTKIAGAFSSIGTTLTSNT